MDEGAGKTTIAVNLARWASRSGQRTLLIDANPENPGLARVIPAGTVAGLIDLGGQSRPVYKLSPNLWLVPILAAEDRVVARLERRAEVERIDQMSRSFDLVIMDGPTIDFDGEAANLARAVDRVIVVAADAGRVPSTRDIVELLDIPESKIAGAVVSTARVAEAA
jgi:Mrp family chromosome partitioning ATPase